MGWNLFPQQPAPLCSRPLAKVKHFDLESSTDNFQEPLTKVQELKLELKALLSKNGGSTNDPKVIHLIHELSESQSFMEDCPRNSNFLGDFIALSCPNFPGRLPPNNEQKEIIQYTLGRMSFSIFQPSKLVCTVHNIRNPVTKNGKTEAGTTKYSYPLVVDMTIHTVDGDLSAVLINSANCHASPDVRNRLLVSFTGGTLLPSEQVRDDPAKLKLWSKTFEGAYKKADKERSMFGSIFQFFIKMVLGLTYPTDESLSKHSFHFEMKRSPVGFLDVLYLDEDLRITKGNRGTIVVVERS